MSGHITQATGDVVGENRAAALRLELFGSLDAIEKWHAAWFALQAFAHASGCPLGRDVATWLVEKSNAYQTAIGEP